MRRHRLQLAFAVLLTPLAAAVVFLWVRTHRTGDIFSHLSRPAFEVNFDRGSVHGTFYDPFPTPVPFRHGRGNGSFRHFAFPDLRYSGESVSVRRYLFGLVHVGRGQTSYGPPNASPPVTTVSIPWTYVRMPIALPAVVLSAYPIYFFTRAARRLYERRRRNRNPHACPTCGYDLRATPDRCPECGAAPTPA